MLKRIINKVKSYLLPINISGNNNSYVCHSKKGRGFKINLIGDNNRISIGKNCLLTNTSFEIVGNNIQVVIEDNVRFIGPCKVIMRDNSTLIIKDNAGIRGVEFNLDQAKIEVGELCMFSHGIVLRNHDSHKIMSADTRTILNAPRDIVLGRHVWVALDATILKGCNIGDDSIIGFGSIVTKSCKPGSIMAGAPAAVVKEGITWDY